MTSKEKKNLAEIVYEFTETRTRCNSMSDVDIVANSATELFNKIIKDFDITKELIEEVELDMTTDSEDKDFLK